LLDTSTPSQSSVVNVENLSNPAYYINRELSWIRFNARVLEEALDLWQPLLERVKFLAICGSNLDEFFMTRVAKMIKKIKAGSETKSVDGMSFMEMLIATRNEIIPLIKKHSECWKNELIPALAKEKINIRTFNELKLSDKEALRDFLRNNVIPTIRVPKSGFGSVSVENLHLTLYISGFENKSKDFCIILDVPSEKFGRFISVPKKSQKASDHPEVDFVALEDLMINNIDLLFPTEEKLVAYPFRLTRNGEIEIVMDESADFIKSVQRSLTSRKIGFPTRIEFDKKTPPLIREIIAKKFGLPEYLLYEFEGPLGLVDLWQLLKLDRPDLKDKTFQPCISSKLTSMSSLFDTISKQDFVLYHPYDSFEVIVDLLKEAGQDKYVSEICITMYRMDHDSPIVEALIQAAKKGKKVTAVVELKAKFDEENNILLVSKLKKGGINAVYNFPNFKVHAKLCLIVRKEENKITRYSHIGSGNYNAVTAKIYADLGYLTANPEVGLELEELFNVIINGLQEKETKRLLIAPKTLKKEILGRIDREINLHQKTGNGYMAFKLNNLEETDIIKALYRASMTGIKIDLNVRGLCCLRPEIKGVSENITVISIVGRFLEHARIYYFKGESEDEVLVGSSDMMFRNLNERIEVLLSVPDPELRQRILKDMLEIHLKDNVKARKLLPDGSYERVAVKRGQEPVNSQAWLIQNRGIWNEHSS
jgi:polyphosphate kinase